LGLYLLVVFVNVTFNLYHFLCLSFFILIHIFNLLSCRSSEVNWRFILTLVCTLKSIIINFRFSGKMFFFWSSWRGMLNVFWLEGNLDFKAINQFFWNFLYVCPKIWYFSCLGRQTWQICFSYLNHKFMIRNTSRNRRKLNLYSFKISKRNYPLVRFDNIVFRLCSFYLK